MKCFWVFLDSGIPGRVSQLLRVSSAFVLLYLGPSARKSFLKYTNTKFSFKMNISFYNHVMPMKPDEKAQKNSRNREYLGTKAKLKQKTKRNPAFWIEERNLHSFF